MLDGNTTTEGRVEICYDNVYGTVCDDQWGPLDAAVACRQLGFSDASMFTVQVKMYLMYQTILGGMGPLLNDYTLCTHSKQL